MTTVSQLSDVIQMNRKRLCRIASHHLSRTEDPEDCVQEAALKAFRLIEQFEGRSSLLTWLTSIVINCARVSNRRKRVNFVGLEETLLLSKEMSAENRMRGDQQVESLNKAVKSLSPVLQRTVLLRYRDGLSLKEIVVITGSSEGTIKSHITRSQAKMKLFCGSV